MVCLNSFFPTSYLPFNPFFCHLLKLCLCFFFFFIFLLPFFPLFPLPMSPSHLKISFLFHNTYHTFWSLFAPLASPTKERVGYSHVYPIYFTYQYDLKVHSPAWKYLIFILFMAEKHSTALKTTSSLYTYLLMNILVISKI